jgi:hypothetical protein
VGEAFSSPWLISPGSCGVKPTRLFCLQEIQMRSLFAIFMVTAAVATAQVVFHQPSPSTDLSVTWSERAAGTNKTVMVNDSPYPWKLSAIEISQPTVITNDISIQIYRAYAHQEQIVGEVTVTNVFGAVETYLDTTVTNTAWRVMTNEVFSAGITNTASSVFELKPVYVLNDDVVVINHSHEDGFSFILFGEK